MSIGKKAFLITLAAISVIVSILYVFTSKFILDSFEGLEAEKTVTNLERLDEIAQNNKTLLELKSSDWAVWDDSYQFMQDRNDAFIESNLGQYAMELLGINLLVFLKSDGSVVYEKVAVPESLEGVSSKINNIYPLIISQFSKDRVATGYVDTPVGIMLIVVRPILKSDGSGPANGYLVFGNLLSKDRINEFSNLLRLPVDLVTLHSETQDLDIKNALTFFSSSPNINFYHQNVTSEKTYGYLLMKDINEKPLFILRTMENRDIYLNGLRGVRYTGIVLVITGLVSLLVILILLHFFVVRPISRLSYEAKFITETRDQRVHRLSALKGNDEISNLVSSINNLLSSLDESSRKLSLEKNKAQKYLEVAGSAIFILDSNLKLTLVNKSGGRLLGFHEDDVIGADFVDRFIPENLRSGVSKILIDTLNGESKLDLFETSILTGGGKRVVMWHCSTFEDASEKRNTIVLSGEDITEKIAADERLIQEKYSVEKKVVQRTKELGEEQAKLRAAINSFPGGFALFDRAGLLIASNEGLSFILRSVSGLWDMAKLKADLSSYGVDIEELFHRCIKERVPIDLVGVCNEQRYLNILVRPVLSKVSGRETAIGVLMILTDVTEEKALQRSRDEFFSIASHELRTPLTAIRGNASLIMEHFGSILKNKDLKEMLDDIHIASVRLIGIVNDFLTTSRLEMGKLTFKKERFDLASLVEEVAKSLATQAQEKALKVLVNKADELPQALGDIDRSREVLINLLGNAIKFTEKGSIELSIIESSGVLKVLIKDTGTGIPADSINLLFKKFQQANKSLYTRDPQRSTGLGLYISRLMAQSMGGNVALETSVEGEGSVFCFTIPCATL